MQTKMIDYTAMLFNPPYSSTFKGRLCRSDIYIKPAATVAINPQGHR